MTAAAASSSESEMSILKASLCDANNKYFWTYPFWKQGIRLKQSKDINKGYMDETAVRARAGFIHLILWVTLICGFVIPQYAVIYYVGPFMFYDMTVGVLFGLTPFCPTGVIGTIIAWNIKPYYTPSAPKRLAWIMGAGMAVICTLLRIFIGPHISIRAAILICIILTFLESSLGFCVGCYFYKTIKKCINNNKQSNGVKVEMVTSINLNDNNNNNVNDGTSELMAIKNIMITLISRMDRIDGHYKTNMMDDDNKNNKNNKNNMPLTPNSDDYNLSITGNTPVNNNNHNDENNICGS